jgi:hypothetical protein
MSVVYLYSYQLPVALSETRGIAPNWNRPMQQYPTNIYKNNNNIVHFVVRNNDRKPVKLVDCVLDVVIQNTTTLETVLEKRACITDEIKGRAELVITSSETQNWSLGGYKFMVKINRPGKHQEMLFVDVNNQTAGELTLLPSVGGEIMPAQTILSTQFTSETVDWDTQTSRNVSGAIPTFDLVGGSTGMITVVLYSQQWRGYFQVQASLSNLAPEPSAWFTVELKPHQPQVESLGDHSQPQVFNFVTNARWLRFVWWDHDLNQGEFQKVVYKIS